MRTQAHRIVDTDPKRGNVVVRVTGTRHDEPTYQARQSPPNTQGCPVMIQAHQLTNGLRSADRADPAGMTGRPRQVEDQRDLSERGPRCVAVRG